MSDVYTFSSGINQTAKVTDIEIEEQLSLLKDFEWFHGVLERNDAEQKITANGEFLVRFSRSNDSKFVVSTKWNGKYLHIVIKKDFDTQKKCSIYYIISRFKFTSIPELLTFHKDGQYPLSNSSEAVLYKAVNVTNNYAKGHRFRKSMHAPHKSQSKALPRSGSEVFLGSERYSSNFTDLNKSLTALPTSDIPGKPIKPSFRLSTSRNLIARIRPKNVHIRNEKLFTEGGDYSDYNQLGDSAGGLAREKVRRGLSMDVSSPSLFGFNTPLNKSTPKLLNDSNNNIDTYLPLRRESASAYLAPCNSSSKSLNTSKPPERETSSVYVLPSKYATMVNKSYKDISKEDMDSAYIIPLTTKSNTPITLSKSPRSSTISLGSFLNLSLSSFPLPCCGPVEGALDSNAINKASTFLLSNPNHPLALCTHLLKELQRILLNCSLDMSYFKIGYRNLFLLESAQFQKDFSIRQTALTSFVMATLVNTTSDERRVNLILFWIKCADILLTHVHDMYHFRSVVTAIFSEQITSLKVWRTTYKKDPELKGRVESLRKALYDGCFMQMEIDQCIPDFVQLYSVFTSKDENFENVCQISLGIMNWEAQSFDDNSTWLVKIIAELDSVTTIPFLRELVQTETLLSLILGKNNISAKDVDPLMAKVEDCIKVIADLRNDATLK